MAAPAAPATFDRIAGCIPTTIPLFSTRLGWAASAGATSYRLERDSGGGVWVAVALTTALFYNQTNLATNTAFDYRVRAENGDGNSSWVTLNFTSPTYEASIASIGNASSFALASVGTSTARFTWADGDMADGNWEIELTNVLSGSVGVFAASGILIEYTFANLAPGSSYSARIRAKAKLSGGAIDYTAWSSAVVFTTDSSAYIIQIPLEITGVVGVQMSGAGVITGVPVEPVFDWAHLPPGVTAEVTSYDSGADELAFAFAGIPTSEGVFDSTISAVIDGSNELQPVRFLISGNGFLAPFHADPDRRDLVLDLRTGEVSGYYFSLTEGLRIDLGADVSAHILLRDVSRWAVLGVTALRLTIQVADNFDSPPVLDASISPPTAETNGDVQSFPFTFRCDSGLLRALFAALDRNLAGSETTRAIACSARIRYVRDGIARASRPFRVTIVH